MTEITGMRAALTATSGTVAPFTKAAPAVATRTNPTPPMLTATTPTATTPTATTPTPATPTPATSTPTAPGLPGTRGPPAEAYDADVLILALDRADETVAAIASVLAQEGVSRHVVVLDQGSRPAALAQIAAAVAGRDDATLVSSGGNLGVAGGRNLAASLGHGRVLVALDNDAEFADSTTLARAVAALDAAPDIAAIGFRIVLHAGGADDLSSWGYPAALLPHAAGTFDATTFVGAGHAIRRSAWDAAGGYDAKLFFCWEELDFCLRAIAAGWRVQYRGDLVVRHKVSAERRVAWSGERWYYFVRNRIHIARKWNAGWPALAPRIAAYLVKGVRNGMVWPTLRAVAAAARMPVAPQQMPVAMRAYLARHDTVHRGGGWMRLRQEILARLPVGRGNIGDPRCARDDRVAGSGPVHERTGPAPTVGR
jgi:GT2 family glycosyltransferase